MPSPAAAEEGAEAEAFAAPPLARCCCCSTPPPPERESLLLLEEEVEEEPTGTMLVVVAAGEAEAALEASTVSETVVLELPLPALRFSGRTRSFSSDREHALPLPLLPPLPPSLPPLSFPPPLPFRTCSILAWWTVCVIRNLASVCKSLDLARGLSKKG